MSRLPALLLAASIPVVALIVLMMSMQTDLLFPTGAVPPAGALPPGAERLEVQTPDGDTLHGVHMPPAMAAEGTRTLILGFGGNAWNGQDVASYLHQVFPEADVVAFHYRGYRPSTGRPSAEALIKDAPLVLNQAIARVKPGRTVAVGLSIGSGVAASLAGRDELHGLILVTPFDSLKAVASQLYPWLPVGPFFQHEIATAEFLDSVETPVAIIAADQDEIIPASRTDALRVRTPNLVFDRTIAGTGHNDIYGREDFKAALREALKGVAGK
ncbi:MAG: alpha/beta hydrolase [Sphingomicrobium sp.]